MDLSFRFADESHAATIATLRTAVADHLTAIYGRGHWSSTAREQGVLRALRSVRVLIAQEGARLVATLTLTTRKPWAINPAYFTPARRPLYLIDMAVAPDRQRQGIGRRLLAEAVAIARAWPSDAIWLDAYDAPAGAGAFYARCGFREVGRAVYRGTGLVYFELRL